MKNEQKNSKDYDLPARPLVDSTVRKSEKCAFCGHPEHEGNNCSELAEVWFLKTNTTKKYPCRCTVFRL